MNSITENTSRRFLLGIASQEEQKHIEDAILGGQLDDISLRDTEDGLIDDYLLNNMTPEERLGFATQFLSTEDRRERLAFAAALIEYAQKQLPQELPARRKIDFRGFIAAAFAWKQAALVAAAASVLLAALAGFQQIQLRRQGQIASQARNELTRLQAVWDSRNNGANQPGQSPTGPGGSLQLGMAQMPAIEFALSTRDVVPPLLRIPAHAQFIRMDVKLSLPLARKYRAMLVSSSGDHLWTQEFSASIVPPTHEITLVLPASLLSLGNYHLQLESSSEDSHFKQSADWVFRVTN